MSEQNVTLPRSLLGVLINAAGDESNDMGARHDNLRARGVKVDPEREVLLDEYNVAILEALRVYNATHQREDVPAGIERDRLLLIHETLITDEYHRGSEEKGPYITVRHPCISRRRTVSTGKHSRPDDEWFDKASRQYRKEIMDTLRDFTTPALRALLEEAKAQERT